MLDFINQESGKFFSLKIFLIFFVIIFAFSATGLCMDPVSPMCESNLSPSQIGLVFDWNNYSPNVFSRKYRSGRYFVRYRKYSYPYLYGLKLGRENIFDPGEYSLGAVAANANYLLVEDTLITPSVSVGASVYYARNSKSARIGEAEVNAFFSKEFSAVMPYFGPALKYSRINVGGIKEGKWGINFKTGVKFYTYPGVSYGVDFTLGRLGGWGLYFNNSW